MYLFFTQNSFTYTHPIYKNKITTNQKIPFFIDNKGELVDVVNKYLLAKIEQPWRGKENTIKTNLNHLKSFLDYIENNYLKITNVSFEVIEHYLIYLKSEKLKENTIKAKLNSIKAFFDWSYQNSFLNENPFFSFSNNHFTKNINSFSKGQSVKTFDVSFIKNKIIKDLKVEDIPSKEDIKSLYKNLNNEYKLMLLCYISTGMRKNELLQITPEMIVNAKDNGDQLSYSLVLDANIINIKNLKSRTVVLDGLLRNKLIKHLKSKEYKKRLVLFKNKNKNKEAPLFISKHGNYYASNTVNVNFKKANKSNFNITIHSLRHYFATHFIKYKEAQGECLESSYLYLSERLGHSSVETTKSYYVKIINKLKEQKGLEEYSSSIIKGIFNE